MDAKKFLASISIMSIVSGISLLNGTNINNEKIVITKSG